MKNMFSFTSLVLVGVMAAVSPTRAQHTKDIVDTAVAAMPDVESGPRYGTTSRLPTPSSGA